MGERDQTKPVKVTVSDPETGEVFEERICANDYCIITAGNRYIKSIQVMGRPGRATHMIAVAMTPATTLASQEDGKDGRKQNAHR